MSAALCYSTPPKLGRLSFEVYEALRSFTAFPWPLLKTQCRRHGVDPASITPVQLGSIIQPLALGVARFNDMNAGVAARRALVQLHKRATSGERPRPEIHKILPSWP